MGTMMGAPNVVRGGSHSGNVSALALVRAGLFGA
jgi:alpha-D-ribose 1-methylphosphonate 5-triphosphate diphosphatase